MSEEPVVYVGDKRVKDYILAIQTQIKQGHPEISIVARGKKISKAVDVVELALFRFIEGWVKRAVYTGTQEKNGDRVSYIELVLVREEEQEDATNSGRDNGTRA